jgi:protein NrfC
MSTPAPRPNARRRQWAHLWDASQCIQCSACSVACVTANYGDIAFADIEDKRGLPSNIARVQIKAGGAAIQALVQCKYCTDAPCMKACPVTPTKAIYRDADGLVLTDEEKCIRCQMCVTACPYGARWSHPVTNVPQSCMSAGCRTLVSMGQQPACVQACPTKARAFGDVKDPGSAIRKRLDAPGVQLVSTDKGTRPNFFVTV